jgi:hypothetical protein
MGNPLAGVRPARRRLVERVGRRLRPKRRTVLARDAFDAFAGGLTLEQQRRAREQRAREERRAVR